MKVNTTTSAAAASKLLVSLSLAMAGFVASASVITSSGDALLTGASIIDFSEVALGSLDPTINGVSFTGIGATLVTLNEAFSGQTPPVLGNSSVPPATSSFGVSFDILFGTDVSAFSLDLAAINGFTTSISAYDDNEVLLQTVAVPENVNLGTATWGLGGYASPISRVRVTTNDFFYTDNLRYVETGMSVPEPSSVALAGLALLGFAATRRRQCRT